MKQRYLHQTWQHKKFSPQEKRLIWGKAREEAKRKRDVAAKISTAMDKVGDEDIEKFKKEMLARYENDARITGGEVDEIINNMKLLLYEAGEGAKVKELEKQARSVDLVDLGIMLGFISSEDIARVTARKERQKHQAETPIASRGPKGFTGRYTKPSDRQSLYYKGTPTASSVGAGSRGAPSGFNADAAGRSQSTTRRGARRRTMAPDDERGAPSEQDDLRESYLPDFDNLEERLDKYQDVPGYKELKRAFDRAKRTRGRGYGDLAIVREKLNAFETRARAIGQMRRQNLETLNEKVLKRVRVATEKLKFSPGQEIEISYDLGKGKTGTINYMPASHAGGGKTIELRNLYSQLREIGIAITEEEPQFKRRYDPVTDWQKQTYAIELAFTKPGLYVIVNQDERRKENVDLREPWQIIEKGVLEFDTLKKLERQEDAREVVAMQLEHNRKSKKTYLSLPSLKERLSEDAAQALAAFDGQELRLNGLNLSSLDGKEEEVAGALADFGGKILTLNGFESLNKEAAEGFSAFRGEQLYLNGVKSMSLDVAQGLGAYTGIIYLDKIPRGDLKKPDVMQALVKNKRGISLRSISRLTKALADAIAEGAKGTHPQKLGVLFLHGVNTLEKGAVEGLTHLPDGVYLNLVGLRSIKLSEAIQFANNFTGTLDLRGLAWKPDDATIAALFHLDNKEGCEVLLPTQIKKYIENNRKKIEEAESKMMPKGSGSGLDVA